MLLGWLVLSVRRGQRVNEDKEGEKRVHRGFSDGCMTRMLEEGHIFVFKLICVCEQGPFISKGIFLLRDKQRGVRGPHQVGDKVFQPSNSERHEQWYDADVPRYGCDDGDTLETKSAWNHRERKGNTKCVRITNKMNKQYAKWVEQEFSLVEVWGLLFVDTAHSNVKVKKLDM